jgi:hypothetical protein
MCASLPPPHPCALQTLPTTLTPREVAAMDSHVRRAAAQAQPPRSERSPARRRAVSAPRARRAAPEEPPAFERLYRMGVARAAARSEPGAPAWLCEQQGRALRLSEGEWGRVAARLHDEARRRTEKLEARREAQAPWSGDATAPAGGSQQRPRSAAAGQGTLWGFRSMGWARSSFLDRQAAHLQRKAEKLRQRELDKEEAEEAEILKTCTCGWQGRVWWTPGKGAWGSLVSGDGPCAVAS